MNARLQELCDRADILDCMYRCARGMDRLHRALLKSAYHDDAVDDHVGFVGPVDDFIDWAFAYHASQTRHQHFVMNHTVDIDGDEAHSETYCMFVGTDRDADKHAHRLRRPICRPPRPPRGPVGHRRTRLPVEWQSEAGSLLPPEAIAFLDTVQTVSRESSDTSYDRPLNVTRVAASP